MAIIKHGAVKVEERQGDPNLNPLAEEANLVLAEAEGVALVIPDIEDAALLGPPPSEQLWAAYRGAGVASYVNAGWLFLNTIGAIFEFLFPHILVPAAEVAPAAETVSAPTAAPDIPVIALVEELEDLNQTGLKRTLYTGSAMIQLEEGSDEE